MKTEKKYIWRTQKEITKTEKNKNGKVIQSANARRDRTQD